jgi:hypothetical protein
LLPVVAVVVAASVVAVELEVSSRGRTHLSLPEQFSPSLSALAAKVASASTIPRQAMVRTVATQRLSH